MGDGGPRSTGKLEHKRPLRPRGSARRRGQQPRAGGQEGVGTAVLLRPPHAVTSSSSPTVRMLFEHHSLPKTTRLGTNPAAAIPQLHDSGQVTDPPRASASPRDNHHPGGADIPTHRRP